MLLSLLLRVVLYFTFSAPFVVAQSSQVNITVCSPDLCADSSQMTIGVTFSPNDGSFFGAVQLLPGVYDTTSQPTNQLSLLSNSLGTLSPSPGFNSSSLSFPINFPLKIALQPGLVLYNQSGYAGQATFLELPSTPLNSTSLAANTSFALSDNVWMAATLGSDNATVIFWNALPDINELPSSLSRSITLIDLQSSTCSPPCTSAGVCSASNTCTCANGFTGSSCQACAEGFSGPNCQPLAATNDTSGCNCVNGECNGDGQCTCNIGWTTANNGTACAQCAEGYYLTPSGDCRICNLGCSNCADETGICTTCQEGFTHDQTNATLCFQTQSVTSDGVSCPSTAFSSGQLCTPCPSSCLTCTAGSSTQPECILCPTDHYFFNGDCVTVDSDGICFGTGGMVANTNKKMCDTCGAKCTTCKIENFKASSTIDQLQCTGCLPGSFLVNGSCVDTCPSGTFGPQNSSTCEACSSDCITCAGTADSCLSCSNGLLASSGSCVATCPTGFFNLNSTCLECHHDCATCSGPSFDQCLTCPPNRPVFSPTTGICLPTCGNQTQYFDRSSSSCQSCDLSCASCSGPSNQECLSCSGNAVLVDGACKSVGCTIMPGLGTCFL